MLRGAVRCIEAYLPALFLEVHADYTRRMGYEPKELFAFLEERGYRSYLWQRDAWRLTDGYQDNGDYLFLSPRHGDDTDGD